VALGVALPIAVGTPEVVALLVLLFAGAVPFADMAALCGLACDATLAGLGKNVALCPLNICHWSQSKTIEKPNITHKTVRRMSFMCFSFQVGMASNV
jgi:hypothetical protein